MAASSDSPITLRFDLKPADVLAFQRDIRDIDPTMRRAESLRRQRGASIGIAVVLGAVLLAGIAFARIASIPHAPYIAIVFASAIFVAVANAERARQTIETLARAEAEARLATPGAAPYHLGPQSVSVGPDGVGQFTGHHDMLQRWSGIADVRDTPPAVCFYRLDRYCIIVPKRIFTSSADATTFVARSRAWLDGAGHGDARRIREHLANHDVPCPGCAYNLRGIITPACPECGREIDITVIAPGS